MRSYEYWITNYTFCYLSYFIVGGLFYIVLFIARSPLVQEQYAPFFFNSFLHFFSFFYFFSFLLFAFIHSFFSFIQLSFQSWLAHFVGYPVWPPTNCLCNASQLLLLETHSCFCYPLSSSLPSFSLLSLVILSFSYSIFFLSFFDFQQFSVLL